MLKSGAAKLMYMRQAGGGIRLSGSSLINDGGNTSGTSRSWTVARRGIDAGLKLRRKTNEIIWSSRRYYSSAHEQGDQHPPNALRMVKGFGSHVGGSRKLTMTKWVVMTGVTLVVGSLLLRTQRFRDAEKDEDGNGTNKPRHAKVRIFNNNWFLFWYSTLPLNAVSRMWGQVNSVTLPIWVRPWSYKLYSVIFGAQIDEMEDPDLTHYENLSQFFYRTIRADTRPIDQRDNVIVCPSDGKVLQFGIIDSETGDIEQIKGLTYSVKEFLGTHANPRISRTPSTESLTTTESDEIQHQEFAKINNIPYSLQDIIGKTPNTTEESHIQPITYESEGDTVLEDKTDTSASKTVRLLRELSSHYVDKLTSNDPANTKLYFAVIYLAPGDYHHYHSPVNWVCKLRRHFPGELFSVAPYFQRNFPNLFILNERVALLGHWKHGFFSMTPVGATNVGSIKLNFDKQLVTNSRANRSKKPYTCYEATYETASKILGGVPLVKGEEMGGFMLGSTVVLCFEAPEDFQFNLSVGDKVKMGQALGFANS